MDSSSTSTSLSAVGCFFYEGCQAYLITDIRPNGELITRPVTMEGNDVISCDDAPTDNNYYKESPEVAQSTSTASGSKITTTRTVKKKVYHKFSVDEDQDLIEQWQLNGCPKKGTDVVQWKRIGQLVNLNVEITTIQSRLIKMMKDLKKENLARDKTSGKEFPHPTPEEKAMQDCLTKWTDIHEVDTENTKTAAKDIRNAAMRTGSSSSIENKKSKGDKLIDLMDKRENREDKVQDLQDKQFEEAKEQAKRKFDLEERQMSHEEAKLNLEAKKVALEEKKFAAASEIEKRRADQEAQRNDLLMRLLTAKFLEKES